MRNFNDTVAFAAAKDGGTAANLAKGSEAAASAPGETVAKTNKSIVPSKYGNKYRNGGTDALAEFINGQCSGKEGFEYTAFFELARKNGVDEAKVAHYEGQVASKEHGAPGRARMTIRNMLAGIARKNGKLVGLDGSDTSIDLPKPAVSGAAKAAQENAGAEKAA